MVAVLGTSDSQAERVGIRHSVRTVPAMVAASACVVAVQVAKYALALSGVLAPSTRLWETTMLGLTALQVAVLLTCALALRSQWSRRALAAIGTLLMLYLVARGLFAMGNRYYLEAHEAFLKKDTARAEVLMDSHVRRWGSGIEVSGGVTVTSSGLAQDLRCRGYGEIALACIEQREYETAERCIQKALAGCSDRQERAELGAALGLVQELRSNTEGTD